MVSTIPAYFLQYSNWGYLIVSEKIDNGFELLIFRGWFGKKKGSFKFVDYGPAWGKPKRPHFPEPGPPVIIKHHPIHVQAHGWGR